MNKAKKQELVEIAQKCDSLEEFKNKFDWEDWMGELLSETDFPTEDGDELVDIQNKIIDDYLKEIYDKSKSPRYYISGSAQYRASRRYEKITIIRLVVKLNKNTDQDIIEHLDSIENKQGYIKELIRHDISHHR